MKVEQVNSVRASLHAYLRRSSKREYYEKTAPMYLLPS